MSMADRILEKNKLDEAMEIAVMKGLKKGPNVLKRLLKTTDKVLKLLADEDFEVQASMLEMSAGEPWEGVLRDRKPTDIGVNSRITVGVAPDNLPTNKYKRWGEAKELQKKISSLPGVHITTLDRNIEIQETA